MVPLLHGSACSRPPCWAALELPPDGVPMRRRRRHPGPAGDARGLPPVSARSSGRSLVLVGAPARACWRRGALDRAERPHKGTGRSRSGWHGCVPCSKSTTWGGPSGVLLWRSGGRAGGGGARHTRVQPPGAGWSGVDDRRVAAPRGRAGDLVRVAHGTATGRPDRRRGGGAGTRTRCRSGAARRGSGRRGHKSGGARRPPRRAHRREVELDVVDEVVPERLGPRWDRRPRRRAGRRRRSRGPSPGRRRVSARSRRW
ncbi:hypothetical protein HBB16_18055 [Pseudonocardia sp. MCCB 268]|nr:hypothetical protein [Pseudonocardia cytotoxica]